MCPTSSHTNLISAPHLAYWDLVTPHVIGWKVRGCWNNGNKKKKKNFCKSVQNQSENETNYNPFQLSFDLQQLGTKQKRNIWFQMSVFIQQRVTLALLF